MEEAVGHNDKQEISRVKEELEEEGLTPDEAAKLIQSVFRKLRAQRTMSKESKGSLDNANEKVSLEMSPQNDEV